MPKILIVDDTDFERNLLHTTLSSLGYEVIGTASNGREGVEQFLQLKPDLVMLDLIMPEMDGIETLRQIKSNDPDAKVMICSTADQNALIALAKRNGARGYVVKPYQTEALLTAVKNIVGEP
jgi:two-component system chemotaxis response regulator CheY